LHPHVGVLSLFFLCGLPASVLLLTTLSPVMNVLRMIKFFAWESKMEERIKEKRTEELGWIKKKKLMDLLNGMLKYTRVHLSIHCLT
jgi:hypothetical protein